MVVCQLDLLEGQARSAGEWWKKRVAVVHRDDRELVGLPLVLHVDRHSWLMDVDVYCPRVFVCFVLLSESVIFLSMSLEIESNSLLEQRSADLLKI